VARADIVARGTNHERQTIQDEGQHITQESEDTITHTQQVTVDSEPVIPVTAPPTHTSRRTLTEIQQPQDQHSDNVEESMLPLSTMIKLPGEVMDIETGVGTHHKTERAPKEHGKRQQREAEREDRTQQQEGNRTTDRRQNHTG
jgi:hypothetical protein